MPITRRLYERLGLALLFAGLLVLLFISGQTLWLVRQSRSLVAAAAHTQDVLTQIALLRASVRTAETSQRGFLLTGNPEYLGPYNAALSGVPGNVAALKTLLAEHPEELPRVDEAGHLIDQKMSELGATVALGQDGKTKEALAIVKTDVGEDLMRAIDGVLNAMTEVELRLRATREAAYGSGNDNVSRLAILAALLTTILGVSLVWITRNYLNALNEIQGELEQANAGLEGRISERTQALQDANEEIQRFAYIVSHDLRSPLVNVMGFTSELEAALDVLRPFLVRLEESHPGLAGPDVLSAVREEMPEALRFIKGSTMKMDRLIKAILQLSREGRRVLTPEPVDLGGVVTSISESLQVMAEERKASIVVGELPSVESDRLALEQILSNLMENAVKYLKPGTAGSVTVTGAAQGPMVEISVRDDGRGIEPRDSERVFELFRRSGIQDQPGEGIGLAHVRTLSRRLGGAVTFVSEYGKGSTFTLTIPRRLRAESERGAA